MKNKDNVVKVLSFHLGEGKWVPFETILDLLICTKLQPEDVKIVVREIIIIDMKEHPGKRVGFLGISNGVTYDNQYKEYKTDIWSDLGVAPSEYDNIWVSEDISCWNLKYVKERFLNDAEIRSSIGKLYDEVMNIEIGEPAA